MKKYYIFLLVTPILFFASNALAYTTTCALSTSTVVSGSESTINVTGADSYQNHEAYYLFSPGGVGLNNNVANRSDGTYAWTVVGYPTGNSAGTYTCVVMGLGAGDSAGAADGSCGTGTTLSSCLGSTRSGTATIAITSGGGGGGGGTSTLAIAPINNVSSTHSLAGLIFNEVVVLPVYELQNYETPLIGIAIILAICGAIFGFLKWFNIL